jgi:hypothetical protein
MSFERWSAKKVYYYVVCAVTLFVLMWGAVDVISSLLSITLFKPPSLSMDAPRAQGGNMASESKGPIEPFVDEYYQSRMAFDRIGDSMARLLVAGGLFLYASFRIKEIEGKEI